MEMKKLRKDNHKLVIGGLIAFCLIAITITYLGTRAKYQNTEIIPLVNGVVNYKAYDFKVMAMYQQKEGQTCTDDSCYNTITTMPEEGTKINESKSYCTIDNKTHSKAKLYTNHLGEHVISKITKNDKCYIWFDKYITEPVAYGDITINLAKPTFSNIATTDEGIHMTTDPMYGEGAVSYYYRGAVTNNYIKFGNFCWRIIRINGDGTIRMIYDGTSCHANGTNTTESIAKTGIYYATNDGNYNNSSYVGWTYELGSQRTQSGTDSNAKQQLENWYNNESGFTSTQKEKIADGKFCNDRNVGEPHTATGWTIGSYTTTWNATGMQFEYAGAKRLWETYQPSLACDTGDTYTLKIGLITADEVEFAGAKDKNNNQYYLYNGQSYWTMSPTAWIGEAGMFIVDTNGYLNGWRVNNVHNLRPVINLKADVTFSSGNGTQTNPYIVA